MALNNAQLQQLTKQQLIKTVENLTDDMHDLYDEEGVVCSSTYQELEAENVALAEKVNKLQELIKSAVASRLHPYFPEELMDKQNCDHPEDCDMSKLYADDFIEMIDRYATPPTSK